MRSFESARMLDPSDGVSQVGSFFCMMQLGSVRAAYAVLLTLNQHDPNPFLHPVDVSTILNSRERVALLRARSQVSSDAPSRNPSVAAMSAFVEWYLGNRTQALTLVQAIAEQSPGSPFDDWATKMQAAMAAGVDVAP